MGWPPATSGVDGTDLAAGSEPMVLERDGRIVAYASHRRLGDGAHGVAEPAAT